METFNILTIKPFLKDYSQKIKFYTSTEEIEHIETNLGIKDKTIDELEELRNIVVSYYTELLNNEIIYNENDEFPRRTEKYFVYLKSLKSVTAVIDNNIYKIMLKL